MVSFNYSLLLAATLAMVCNGYHHHGVHRRAQIHARHFANGTTTEPSYPPIGTGVEEPPVGYPEVPTHAPIPSDVPTTTTCITEVVTNTYTYTLGNGHAVTTCITKTNFITKTIPITEAPAPTEYPYQPETVKPTGSFSSTTTSTTTKVVTLTRPYPEEETSDAGVNDVPSCTPHTVYLPETVYITVPQSTITVTVNPGHEYSTVQPVPEYPTEEPSGHEYPTVQPVPEHPTEQPSGYPEPPVITEEPIAYPPAPTPKPITTGPYHNTTVSCSNSTAPSTSIRYVTVVPYE